MEEGRPSLKGYLDYIALTVLPIVITIVTTRLLRPVEASAALVGLAVFISIVDRGKRDVLTSLPLVVAAIVNYIEGPLYATIAVVVLSAIEMIVVMKYVKSTKFVVAENEVIIEKDYLFKKIQKTVLKDSISEITMTQSLSEKVLGVANIMLRLRNNEVITIKGVPRRVAERMIAALRGKEENTANSSERGSDGS